MPYKGYKQTIEHRKKTSKSRIERKNKLGYLNSFNTRKKLSLIAQEQKLSKEHKEKLQIGFRNKIEKQGYFHSIDVRNIIRQAKIKENNPNWQGGISYEPYTTDWTETLRRSIRERDNYICQICSQYGNIVHHIDYDKKNCNPNNLITLCRSCHSKTNNHQGYWKAKISEDQTKDIIECLGIII